MKNPKTTIAGYLVLASVVLGALSLIVQGQFAQLGGYFSSPLVQGQIAVGLGLVASADGGH